MNLEVLLATMNQEDHSILDKMKIGSDIIIANQCNKNAYEEFEYKNNKVRFFSFNERGVGLNRNNALMRAKADICLFADDDVVYVENYKELILKEFENNPKADIIIFSFDLVYDSGVKEIKLKRKRARLYNLLSHGTCRIAIRKDKIIYNNVFFHLLFGGGAKYSCGEDSIFLMDSWKKGLKIYTSPIKIGKCYKYESTWFKGYNKKYFMDKGVLFKHMFGVFSSLIAFRFIIKHSDICKNQCGRFNALKYMIQGGKEYKKIK